MSLPVCNRIPWKSDRNNTQLSHLSFCMIEEAQSLHQIVNISTKSWFFRQNPVQLRLGVPRTRVDNGLAAIQGGDCCRGGHRVTDLCPCRKGCP